MGSQTFVPDSHTISSPGTISWRNESGVFHNVTSDGGPWPSDVDVDLPSGADDLEVDLVTPGVYTFFCNIHEAFGMTGTITVTG